MSLRTPVFGPAARATLHAACLCGILLPAAAKAEDGFSYEGNLTGTLLGASDDRADTEGALSGDLVGAYTFGSISIVGHLEGSTTPRTNGVAALAGDSNADSGTALNSSGDGRIQLSELFLQFETDDVIAAGGLIDATGWLDTSAVANDEHSQFLNATLVNNPTIEFPDYTIGAVFTLKQNGGVPALTAFIGGSNGLGDNPEADYGELLDLNDSGKGVFGAVEAAWALPSLGEAGALRLGAWTNTADHAKLSAAPGTEDNYGFYGVLDGTAAPVNWSLRAGMANADVSPAAWFVGGALEYPLDPWTLGLGATYTAASDDLGAGFDDKTNAEVYARYAFTEYLNGTLLVQWQDNPNFDDTGATIDESLVVFGARIGVDF